MKSVSRRAMRGLPQREANNGFVCSKPIHNLRSIEHTFCTEQARASLKAKAADSNCIVTHNRPHLTCCLTLHPASRVSHPPNLQQGRCSSAPDNQICMHTQGFQISHTQGRAGWGPQLLECHAVCAEDDPGCHAAARGWHGDRCHPG